MNARILTASMTMFALILFFSPAWALPPAAWKVEAYVDDNLDYLDPEETAPQAVLDPLPDGLVPTSIEAPEVLPDRGGEEDLSVDEPADGNGPLVNDNYVTITIANSPSSAGSNMDYILMRFGREGDQQLNGAGTGGDRSFPRGGSLTWDLNDAADFLEDVDQDAWDHISFLTNSGDGLLVSRLVIVHSGVTILDWAANIWMDDPDGKTLGTAAKCLERKLSLVDNTSHAAVSFAARELGKTDGDKYGTSGLWCSEFASWCLSKDGWGTPSGSIGTDDMKDYFSDRGRLYTPAQVRNGTYELRAGDYLSLFGGDHSAIFFKWIDSTATITNATRFKTIEGNTGSRVATKTRTVGDIDRVGGAQ